MLKTFQCVVENVHYKSKEAVIDNFVSKLYYRASFAILLTSTILVCSRQYVGEHIRCVADHRLPIHVINTYCFFTTTFTVVKHANQSALHSGVVPHLGVGPYVENEDAVKYHAFYQWVPFMLFLQALMFYAPHYYWRNREGGRMKALVKGLQHAYLSLNIEDMKLECGVTIPSKKNARRKIILIRDAFVQRKDINKSWTTDFVISEVINAANLVVQIYITDVFLGGTFLNLGRDVLRADGTSEESPLDLVFPKVTKCNFRKYGPSGSLQLHDALCVMALNVVNEKIYVFLWFWFVVLCVLTLAALLWRLLTVILHARCLLFNRIVFGFANPQVLDLWSLVTVTKECHFSDWLFLYYLAKNLDGFVFRELFLSAAVEISDVPPETYHYASDDDDEEEAGQENAVQAT
ncbi:innexin inx7-like [Zootermopsis nevadensis]|uniref:Innexin n=1 Tax=Zootermopsis nevadensis TaxID=136037 RepID=A0A067QS42_ZOONE|nr:innexin inx7-like [Zootermopsis nevadensis]KDR11526.1 Innexin inx7 [Zootermopsis nevadensis]